MNTPLDQLELIEQRPATRTSTHPFLFKKDKICEITGAMMTTNDSLHTDQPKLKSGTEIWTILEWKTFYFSGNVIS